MAETPLDAVRVDGDDLADLIPEIEASFAVTLPQDLRHVQTAGALFDEILRCRTPAGAGERCDTQMAFYRVRRLLVKVGLDTAAARGRTPSAYRTALLHLRGCGSARSRQTARLPSAHGADLAAA
ncbi:MAG: hypothetical protein H2049_04880 [Porphyrobacter sp.]|nr:hypothetical protein [Porphyrobacter sp.]